MLHAVATKYCLPQPTSPHSIIRFHSSHPPCLPCAPLYPQSFPLLPYTESLFLDLCNAGRLAQAFHLLSSSTTPFSARTYLCILQASIKHKNLAYVHRIHSHLVRFSVDLNGLLGDYLVVTLAKCGAIDDASRVSKSLTRRTVHSWTALIFAFADSDCGRDAIQTYWHMQEDNVEPNSYTFVGLFKACGIVGDLETGRHLHEIARRKGLAENPYVGNAIVGMYGKSGAVVDAEDAFSELRHRGIISWSVMLSVYVQQGQEENALRLYRQMQEEGIRPNQHGLTSIVHACGVISQNEEAFPVRDRWIKVKALEIGKALHAHPHLKGWQQDVVLGTALLSMYGKCGAVAEAIDIFQTLPYHDIVSWNALLSMFVEQGQRENALTTYTLMLEDGIGPTQLTFVIALQACDMPLKIEKAYERLEPTKSICLEIGKALHTDVIRRGFASDAVVSTGLISMYSRCGVIEEVESVFSTVLHNDAVLWNAMLSAYVEHNHGEKALLLYRQMQAEGVNPNEATYVIIIQSCGLLVKSESVSSITKEMCFELLQALHADARRRGFMSNVIVGNSLLNLYGKLGTLGDVDNAFHSLPCHDIISWTTLLLAYVDQGQGEKALLMYSEMEAITLDEVVLVCILQACKAAGNLVKCNELHFAMVSSGCDQSLSLAVSLVSTYGSCASIVDAEAAFDSLYDVEITTWTACITGHAEAGHSLASLQVLEQLRLAGTEPDGVTFTSILAVCCHTGLVIEGLHYFLSMRRDYGIAWEPCHYAILVDAYGRVGSFNKIENMFRKASMQNEISVWLCLLGACRSHGNVELAERAFDHATCLHPENSSAYVFLSNIYADRYQVMNEQ